MEPSNVEVDAVVEVGVVEVGVVEASVVGSGAVEAGLVVVVSVTDAVQAAKTSNRTIPRLGSDVASAHHKTEKEPTGGRPYQGEVVAYRIDRRSPRNTKDGGGCDTTYDAHEDHPKEAVGIS